MKTKLLNGTGAGVPIKDQIACVKREIAMRKKVYRRRISMGNMTREEAEMEIKTMEAVLDTLNEVAMPGLGLIP